jgi:large subunit ribosomal protein L32
VAAISALGHRPLSLLLIVAADGLLAATSEKENFVMAVPKRRMSRANTRSRRAQWKAKRPELVNVTVAGQQHRVPRRLLKAARLGLVDLDRR